MQTVKVERRLEQGKARAGMGRELVGFLIAGAVIVFFILAEFSTQTVLDCGEACGFSTVREPYAALWALVVGAFAIVFPQSTDLARTDQGVDIWRRLIAYLIDFFGAAIVGLVVMGAALQLIAFMVFGTTDLSVIDSSDPIAGVLGLCGLLGGFALMYFFLWLPPKLGRATPGQYVMGYRIVSNSDVPQFAMRPVLIFVAHASAHIWIWFDARGRNDGHFWWDRVTGTRAVKVEA